MRSSCDIDHNRSVDKKALWLARWARTTIAAIGLGFLGAVFVAPAVDAHETARGPKSVADLADQLMGAVVNISTTQVVETRRGIPIPQVPEGSPFQEFFEDFFEKDGATKKRKQKVQSLGSGFVIDPSGLIVTNNHVISDADEISVKFSDGKQLIARILGRDSKTDLAILKVDSDKPLPTVKFGPSETMRVGDWVMAIGNPFGLGGSVTIGIVSARNRDINSGPYDNFIQTDAAINRGNSGGPLFDMHGNVVGINTAIISPTGGSIGLGFAIPSEIAQHVLDQLKEYGETRRGWLGIRIQQVTEDLAEGLGLDEVRGALVSWVNEEGPAYAAQIRPGDVVIGFDGRDIDTIRDLTRMVADTKIGRKVKVVIIRKGKRQTLTVKIGHLEASEDLQRLSRKEQSSPILLGMSLTSLTEAERKKHGLGATVEGVVVEAVEPGSQAAEKGIAAGMVIVEMDQEIVSTPEDVAKRVQAHKSEGKQTILFLLARPDGGELVFVPLRLPKE
ncbi:Do family serine endopeptidase [Cohaesibacter gelatinilyticus]|uniref:Probable periplasmic serine endoprotease DegP-like n=1 Tax=Cohaesibacter gelatinilyticus TaxID=372072 RepID=A0A285NHR1_9HYPH|nr:Do family serine endopeptidase [Cohaesibacter gelatinilyticus]SNZ08985.1 serine protease Do [Cohaesibacter gelatinilyticus]HAT87528.1 Do family serine endopeptidase [Hyphomicrobiales bacterium]